MPAPAEARPPPASEARQELRFPPVTRNHIIHCGYQYWHPKYRSCCIKSRIVPLPAEFMAYLDEDGILLADEDGSGSGSEAEEWEPSFRTHDRSSPSDSDADSDPSSAHASRLPPNRRFPALHAAITQAIRLLGGSAAPKLNWTAPQDAVWISRHVNTLRCTTANDVYALLKSSSLIRYDLDHAFDDVTADEDENETAAGQGQGRERVESSSFVPVLVLRAFFQPLPSLEFRCFVKDRTLVALSARDLRFYAFQHALRPHIVARARELFTRLRRTFPDACFVFDLYVPEAGHEDGKEAPRPGNRLGRARLMDISPWAPRTDPLLFDWAELLAIQVPRPLLGPALETDGTDYEEEEEEEDDDDDGYEPELRLLERDDPAAFNFSPAPYSAYKLPRDVVDAGAAGLGGIREFLHEWKRATGEGDGEGQAGT